MTHTKSSAAAADRAACHASAAVACTCRVACGAMSASSSASTSGGTHRGLFPYLVRWKVSKYPASSVSMSAYCLSDDTANTTAFRPGTGRHAESVSSSASTDGTLWAVSRITVGRSPTSSILAGHRTPANPFAIARSEIGIPVLRSWSSAATATAAFAAWCAPSRPSRNAGRGGSVTVRRAGSYSNAKSRPACTTFAPTSAATCSITPRGPAAVTPHTTGTPGLMMPAFWYAIASSVFPSWAVWSMPTDVTTDTSGAHTFVLSNRPPRPTSTTAASHRRWAKCRKPTAVPISKNVGGGPHRSNC